MEKPSELHDNKSLIVEGTTTTQLSEEKFILKKRPIVDDIRDNRFINPNTTTHVKKRNKSRELEDERIKLTIYKHKCGFSTHRPLVWARVIEEFTNDVPGVKCRWNYGLSDNSIVECQIHFYYDTTKKVVINIYLRTGVVIVNGNNYVEWANEIFPQIKEKVDHLEASKFTSVAAEVETTPNEHIIINTKKDDITENHQVKDINKNDKLNSDKNEIDILWDENIALKNALNCLEKKWSN